MLLILCVRVFVCLCACAAKCDRQAQIRNLGYTKPEPFTKMLIAATSSHASAQRVSNVHAVLLCTCTLRKMIISVNNAIYISAVFAVKNISRNNTYSGTVRKRLQLQMKFYEVEDRG
jgi:hypothetical protein